MDKTLDQYDGARLSCQPRTKNYRVVHKDGTQINMEFTNAQAAEYGTVLEPDGIDLMVAIRMIDNWNEKAKQQRNNLRYAIPFVKRKD